jgi:dTDP-glucose pyrophosphorylase
MRHKIKANVRDFFVTQESSVREVVSVIENNSECVVIIVDKEGIFVDVITDGDVRRAFLGGIELGDRARDIQADKKKHRREETLVAEDNISDPELHQLMIDRRLSHVPLVCNKGKVVDLGLLSWFTNAQPKPAYGVVMAGGYGKRLYPLTKETPKPMLHVGDKPILESIISQMRAAEIVDIFVTTHYQSEKIENYFGSGAEFGVNIEYILEDTPLGTVGSLRRLSQVDRSILLINGDIYSEVEFDKMLTYHSELGADLTLAVKKYEINIPYGIVEVVPGQVDVQNFIEKPTYKLFTNAGIYILEPSVIREIPKHGRVEMNQLLNILISKNKKLVTFPLLEQWIDIGVPKEYERANEIVKNMVEHD